MVSHHSHHHHKGPSFGKIMHSIGGTIKQIEKPIVHLEETGIKTIGSVAHDGLGVVKSSMLPIIIVGGVVAYYVLTKK